MGIANSDVRDGNQVGFSFSLNQNNSQENIKKSFLIGFTFAEGRMLKQYALTVLNNYFLTSIEENQFSNNNGGNGKKTQEKVETPPKTENNSQEIDLDVPF